jgi:hypothetical protein
MVALSFTSLTNEQTFTPERLRWLVRIQEFISEAFQMLIRFALLGWWSELRFCFVLRTLLEKLF